MYLIFRNDENVCKAHAIQNGELIMLVIPGKTATIKDYRWTSESKALETLLNAKLPVQGPSGADPHPDLTAATQAANDLGGHIVSERAATFDPDLAN